MNNMGIFGRIARKIRDDISEIQLRKEYDRDRKAFDKKSHSEREQFIQKCRNEDPIKSGVIVNVMAYLYNPIIDPLDCDVSMLEEYVMHSNVLIIDSAYRIYDYPYVKCDYNVLSVDGLLSSLTTEQVFEHNGDLKFRHSNFRIIVNFIS